MRQFLSDALALLRLQVDATTVDRFCNEMQRLHAQGCTWVSGFGSTLANEVRVGLAVERSLLELQRDECYRAAQAILDGAGPEGDTDD